MPEVIATEPSTVPEAGSVIASFNDYKSLVAALRLAREIRNISFTTLDEIVTASDGYFSKVLAPNGSRRLTPLSLGWALGALGVKCLLVDDPEQLQRVGSQFKPRTECMVRDGAVHVLLSTRMLRENGRKGGLNSRKNLGKRRIKQLARKAAYARWRS
jgi:hypothetical protein